MSDEKDKSRTRGQELAIMVAEIDEGVPQQLEAAVGQELEILLEKFKDPLWNIPHMAMSQLFQKLDAKNVPHVIADLLGYHRVDKTGFKEFMAGLLGYIDPTQPYGTALFDALARLSWSIAFEAVTLRQNAATGEVEVYLRQREANDTAYPSQWHCPGTVIRPGERPQHQANRLEKEFGCPINYYTRIAGLYTSEERGSFLSEIYSVELGGDPRIDDRHRWFPVTDLPEVTVDFHRNHIIPTVYLHYCNTRSHLVQR